jgi:hypothetical protein
MLHAVSCVLICVRIVWCRKRYVPLRRACFFVNNRLFWVFRWKQYKKQCRKADFFRKRSLFRAAIKLLSDWAVLMAQKRGEEAEFVKCVVMPGLSLRGGGGPHR